MGETAWGSNETGAQGDETRIAAALEKRRGIEDAASSAQLESAFVGKYFKCRRCQKGGWKSQECHLLQKAKCKGTKYALKGLFFGELRDANVARVLQSAQLHRLREGQVFCIVGPLYREAALVTVICHILLQRLLRLRDVPCLRTLQ